MILYSDCMLFYKNSELSFYYSCLSKSNCMDKFFLMTTYNFKYLILMSEIMGLMYE